MIEFYNEIVSTLFNEYVEQIKVFPIWFICIYLGLVAAGIVYSVASSRTLSRVIWCIFTLAFPLLAFPIELVQHFFIERLLNMNDDETASGRVSHRVKVRRRFVIIPALGAVLFWGIELFFTDALPLDIRQRLGLIGYNTPWLLTGAILFLTILFLAEYRNVRRDTSYFRITVKFNAATSARKRSLYGHEISDEVLPEYQIDSIARIIRGYYTHTLFGSSERTSVVEIDNIRYSINVMDEAEYNNCKDIESVQRVGHFFGTQIDKIIYIDWTDDKDKITDRTKGTRKVLWRSTAGMYPLITEALSSLALIMTVLSPLVLASHVGMLSYIADLFFR